MTALRKLKQEEKYTYEDYIHWEDDWEVIDGTAYAMSPSAVKEHQGIAGKIYIEIGNFLKGKTCKPFYEFDVILSKNDIVRPDIIVVCDKNKIEHRGINGAPDLVVEILSPSTARKDRVEKFELYKTYGVREYWIVDPYNMTIEVFDFENDKKYFYNYDEENKENMMEVLIFKGELKIDVNYIFEE